jgi:hypothetical protein
MTYRTEKMLEELKARRQGERRLALGGLAGDERCRQLRRLVPKVAGASGSSQGGLCNERYSSVRA